MSDLISRKALIDSMDKRYKEKVGIVQDNLAEGFMQMEKLIKEQQTAYDLESVIDRLEKEKESSYYEATSKGGRANGKGIAYGKNLAYQKALEIIKSGTTTTNGKNGG